MSRNIQKCLVVLLLWLRGVLCAAAPQPIWIDVPFVKQERNGCGAASIAMVMQYWERQQGKAVETGPDAAKIQRELYSDKSHGIYASDLERYLRQHEFRTFAFQGEWSDLEQHLEKGRPLIVALKPRFGTADLHYVVVAGLDAERGLVFVNDPAQRKLLTQEWSEFKREWKGAGNWILLAVPLEETPSVH